MFEEQIINDTLGNARELASLLNRELASLLAETRNIRQQLSGEIYNNGHMKTKTKEPPPELSKREKQIWEGFSEGLDHRAIALKLEITPKTVEVHRTNIRKKLNLKSVKEFYNLVREK